MEQKRGTLVLNSAPNIEVEQKIGAFLARHVKNIPSEQVAAIAQKVPVILCKNISEKAGQALATSLQKLGASATYVPEKSVTAHDPIEKDHMRPSTAVDFKENRPSPEHLSPPFKVEQKGTSWKAKLLHQAIEANKELWLILSMIAIAGLMNHLVASHRVLLSFYTLPTLLSAYFYGRRHASLTAFASVLLVTLVMYCNPGIFNKTETLQFVDGLWYDIAVWGCILVITAYATGTLYERNEAKMRELRNTYRGLLVILRHFISKDKYTENHCYRVSIYAAKIAVYLGFNADRVEDIRSAALLHDIGKLDISRELLYKAAKLSQNEFEDMKRHVDKGVQILEPMSGPLGRIIPIILSHHDRYDGSGYHPNSGKEIPLEARVLAVADVYDALASDRPYRKALSSFEAKDIIAKGSGTDFDPRVVNAFLEAFNRREMEIPNVMI